VRYAVSTPAIGRPFTRYLAGGVWGKTRL